MKVRWQDHITPTAATLVSRAWVIAEVARAPGLDDRSRAALIEDLVAFEPPRRHGLRNNFIAWLALIALSWLAAQVGLPAWVGFTVALLALLAIARVLTMAALRWRLQQRIEEIRRGR